MRVENPGFPIVFRWYNSGDKHIEPHRIAERLKNFGTWRIQDSNTLFMSEPGPEMLINPFSNFMTQLESTARIYPEIAGTQVIAGSPASFGRSPVPLQDITYLLNQWDAPLDGKDVWGYSVVASVTGETPQLQEAFEQIRAQGFNRRGSDDWGEKWVKGKQADFTETYSEIELNPEGLTLDAIRDLDTIAYLEHMKGMHAYMASVQVFNSERKRGLR